MTADPPNEDPPEATEEDYGAPEVPEGQMLTPEGVVDCLPEQQNNGQDVDPGARSTMITDLLWGVERLRNYEPVTREWVVPGCIPCGEVCLLTGPGGLGKSTLAIMLQVAMAGRLDWMGYETMQGASLGMYAEEDQNELARRFQAVRRRLGVAWDLMSLVQYVPLKGKEVSLTKHNVHEGWVDPTPLLDELHRLIISMGVKLAILDSLNRMYSSSENDRPMVTGYLRALENVATETGCAILLLGHPSKSALTDGSGYSGSTAWDSMVRARAYLSYQHVPDPDLLSAEERASPILKLSWKKGNYAARSPDIELQISFDAAAPKEEPPIFEKIPENETDNRLLFLKIIDKLNADGDHPRPTDKGTAKMLYAPTAVYLHRMNRRQEGLKKQITEKQCVELYRSLMVELGLLKIVMIKTTARHKVDVIQTIKPRQEEEPQNEIPF